MIFAHIYDAHTYEFLHTYTTRIHACMVEASAVMNLSKKAHNASSQQNVSIFRMLAQKTRQKAVIRPDKVGHFTRSF